MKKGMVPAALTALVLGIWAVGGGSSNGGLGLSDAQRTQLSELAQRVLTDGIQARSPSVRVAAAWAWGRVPSPASEAIPLLLQALREERSWRVRVAAAHALGSLQAASAALDLAEALRQAPDEITRRAFRDALIELGEPAVSAVTDLLGDPAEGVRRAAASALGRIGSPAALPALMRTLNPRYEGAPRVRQQAAQALGEIRSPEAVPALLEALASDPHGTVRLVAVGALGRIGDPRAAPALLDALKGEDFLLRAEAALALGRLQGRERESLQALLDRLAGEENGLVRSALALGLGETRRPEAVPALVDLLQGPEPESVRRSAAWGLAQIATPEAEKALEWALASPQGEVRQAAAFALGAAGNPAAAPILRRTALDDPDPEDRARAAQLLGSLGSAAAVEPLTQLLRDDRYPSVRRVAAQALASLGQRAAVPALLEALIDDPDLTVRAAAAEALGVLGDPRAIPVLTEALATAPQPPSGPLLEDAFAGRLAQALARLGPASLPTLKALLEGGNETARRAAAFGLELLARRAADLGDPALVEGLAEVLPLLHEKLLEGRVRLRLEQIDAARALWVILKL